MKNIYLVVIYLTALIVGFPAPIAAKSPTGSGKFYGSKAVMTDLLYTPVEITGRVVDSTGSPLPGVTVMVKGNTSKGTTTDLNGRYVLEVPEDVTLVFSMVGFGEQEVVVSGRKKIDVVMVPSSTALGETVVVALGSKKKREDVVGAISTVRPEDLKIPASNLTTALGGRAAGVIAYQRTGEPGQDNANFFVRGVTTFGYKVDPLILVDNVEVTPTDLARLQVDDIESFSILKDATAAAVYGARGANGVILITTKEGKEGKVKTSLRVENSVSMPTRKVELADPITYMKMANEAVLGRDPLGITFYSPQQIENTRLDDPHSLQYPAIDWRKELLKDYAINQRVNLSVNGGGKVARYYVSGAFNRDNGILKVPKRSNFNNNIDLKSYSLRGNVDISLTSTTELRVRLNGSFDDYQGPVYGGTKIYHDIMRTSPSLYPPYYPPGATYQYLQHIMFGNYDIGEYLNPYAEMVKGYKQYSRSKMKAQLELNQDFGFLIKGLSFDLRATASRYSYFSITRTYNPFYYHFAGIDSSGQNIYDLLNEESGTEFLDYSEGSKDVESVFFMQAIVNFKRNINNSTLNAMLVSMLRSELDGNSGSLQKSLPHRNLGFAGRMTYDYKSRYYLEFDFGYNGSERFSKLHRFGFFPSVGVAWNLSKEPFWETVKPVVSNLRLRATYGVVGNDAIGSPTQRFFYLSELNMHSSDRGWYFGENREDHEDGIAVDRYANNDITWETAYKTDIGVEMSLFNNLEINGDYFQQTRKNIFMQRADIPISMGLSAPVYANVGEASAKGIDVSVNYFKSYSNSVWFKALANFTYATSQYKVYEEPDYKYPWLYHVGYPLNIKRGYIAERLFIDEKDVANSPEQQFASDIRGGDIKYVDVNNDGVITTLDKVPLGYPTVPEINYGFGFSTGYKGVDFSVFFEGLARESFFINPQATAPFRRYVYSSGSSVDGNYLQNQVLKVYADNHWSEENKDLYALYPRLSWTEGNSNNEQVSTWWMRNGKFLRVKQVELGYSFPNRRLLDKLGVRKLRLYVNAMNLFTFSKFKLWDVEMGANGLDYPIQKVVNVGVKLDF